MPRFEDLINILQIGIDSIYSVILESDRSGSKQQYLCLLAYNLTKLPNCALVDLSRKWDSLYHVCMIALGIKMINK